MTREEIEQKIVEVKWILERAERSSVCVEHIKKNNTKRLADLEKQLAELNKVEVYEPIYMGSSFNPERQIKIDRHNAGEELKKIISEENAKQGWKVDWEDDGQVKAYIHSYSHTGKEIDLAFYVRTQTCESELYFSEQSSENQDFLDKIKPLWLKWKGI